MHIQIVHAVEKDELETDFGIGGKKQTNLSRWPAIKRKKHKFGINSLLIF